MKKLVIAILGSSTLLFIGVFIYANYYIIGNPQLIEYICDLENKEVYGVYSRTMHTGNAIDSYIAKCYAKIFLKSPDLKKCDGHLLWVLMRGGLNYDEMGIVKCATMGILRNDITVDYYRTTFEKYDYKKGNNDIYKVVAIRYPKY